MKIIKSDTIKLIIMEDFKINYNKNILNVTIPNYIPIVLMSIKHLADIGIKALLIDMDKTILKIHSYGTWALTKKPLEVRMGKGKGNVEYWVSLVQPGTVLYEMAGVSEEVAREAFKLAAAKLPVRTTFIKKAL